MPGGKLPESRMKLACTTCEVTWYGYTSVDKCWICGGKADAYNLRPPMQGYVEVQFSAYVPGQEDV